MSYNLTQAVNFSTRINKDDVYSRAILDLLLSFKSLFPKYPSFKHKLHHVTVSVVINFVGTSYDDNHCTKNESFP